MDRTSDTRRWIGLLVLACVFCTGTAWAQQASGIAGLVSDETGGVLPGVTVEAASPALIEQVRTAVTDGDGRYNVVQLRPGEYTITFSLPGFSVVRREGITLTAGFTASVNAELHARVRLRRELPRGGTGSMTRCARAYSTASLKTGTDP